MTIRRITPNLYTADPARTRTFCAELSDLEAMMDHGWTIAFTDTVAAMTPQVSVANGGGNGTPMPVPLVEANGVDAVHTRAVSLNLEIVYPLVDEPWDVRRFYVRNPFGNVVNILAHR